MAETNQKLDRILTLLENLTTRLDRLENSVSDNHSYVSKLDQKFTQRCDELEGAVKQKTESTMFAKLQNKVKNLEIKLEISSEQEAKHLESTTKVEQKFESYFLEAERAKITSEAYSKRLNILVHGIEEHHTNPWETREETLTKLNKVLSDGLRLDNHKNLRMVDVHRLPQRPIYKNGNKINCPIIRKLSSINDKQSIMKATKHLKEYNNAIRSKNYSNNSSVYITDHLPKLYYQQKKKLLPQFKQAKSFGKKTIWRIITGECCLFIDGVRASQ